MRSRRNFRRRDVIIETISNKNFIIASIILTIIILFFSGTIIIKKQIDRDKIAKQAENLRAQTGEIFSELDSTIENASQPSENVTRKARISAVGDILCQNEMMEDAKVNETYDFSHMFANITKYTKEADVTVGTLETNLVEKSYSGTGKYNAPTQFLKAVKDSGINLVSVAHNHALDYGKEGFERTIKNVQNEGISVTGVANNSQNESSEFTGIIKDVRGIKVAFLAYTYGLSNSSNLSDEEKSNANIYSEEIATKDIEYAKENSNYIIVLMHWGDVNSSKISDNQTEIADFLVKQGVDMILGSHPSVVEPMKIVQNKEGRNVLIAYSLGNYISNLKYKNADVEIILNIEIVKEADSDKAILQKVDYTPIYMLDNGKNTENRFELADMKQLVYNYAAGDQSKITRKKYDEIVLKLEELQKIINAE